ncbi:hypothetical protein BCR44DRAFT_294839 [Catenaria anguillulae PL171]|uniref:Uncharacterized protein n=1 Tax=Catenaria anguillulae PL171 TaxID=765915 RepID=A0A1Y2HPF2_9FUNG|nr:hypothetical protein BCR44DRAFT_294839 [Catenaria anguillulae PL171]
MPRALFGRRTECPSCHPYVVAPMTASNELTMLSTHQISLRAFLRRSPTSTSIDPAALVNLASHSLAPAHALALESRCHATHQPNLMLTFARQQ